MKKNHGNKQSRPIALAMALLLVLVMAAGCWGGPASPSPTLEPSVSASPIASVSPSPDMLPTDSGVIPTSCTSPTPEVSPSAEPSATAEVSPSVTPSPSPVSLEGESDLLVHYIDVGQGDCILIQANGMNMLIDAGDASSRIRILGYLNEQKVERIDYLIATHPHVDHIGSMADVIEAFDIGTVYMPRKTANTQTYEKLLTTISNKGLRIQTAVPGMVIQMGKAAATILSPKQEYSDINTNSIVIRLVNGQTSFLFTGDATEQTEKDILSSGALLKSDVLKVGHHGSDTSTSQAFLNAVSPSIAVIMVGAGNSYGHPNIDVVQRLEKKNITIYRTDQHGILVIQSNGKTLNILR